MYMFKTLMIDFNSGEQLSIVFYIIEVYENILMARILLATLLIQ